MANEPIITLIGNLTADPELRFLPNGTAVANINIASTPRVKDGDDWKDGETLFVRGAVWREPAENVAESLSKGTRVIVQGRLKVNNYEKDGVKRTSLEMDVDEVGPALRYATARVTKVAKGGSQPQSAPAGDPWGSNDDSPPF